MKAKRKNAPHLADQVQDGAELIILIGSKAWQAWDMHYRLPRTLSH
ncbi:D5 N like family [Aggregatibacter actinomycetemcomitans serotype e str. SC1083]|uniref:D5 N like family n=1 Tax=Aggregatibacter actinomycetemcomitans serotype e str. SC1083 TaxID=907488 RepID=G4A9X8_AGGAC|nr:hypothetical protein [Aggregatibacter actinomycetemcomitans]EGY33090.1 D5 N like family [Aggregatibacter actinomycetemcomitans serotype e str. SC1083]KYK92288.1 hypothetical protein ANH9776_09535 [Aggregatibacter actinomycetemcomitans serotype e str. ANH9776]